MRIKSIHKKGSKFRVENRRGLFITNIKSKIYERVMRQRNMQQTIQKASQYQCGGVRHRSIVDQVFTILAIIDRNKYLERNTYLTFADAEKCFDKLWLEDGVRELMRSGTSISDATMVYKMNSEANATISCPAGETRTIHLNKVVRQGTVYGPQLCSSSTESINSIAERIVTHYGPQLQIEALIYVDDIASAGDHQCDKKTIKACRRMEIEKKFTFNLNKSATLIVKTGNKEEKIQQISAQVKRGAFPEVKQYKYLGTIISEDGSFKASLQEMEKSIQYRVTSIQIYANASNIGRYANQARIKLLESIIIPSIMVNIEAWPAFTPKEIQKMESIQGQALKRLFGLPRSTSYIGMLMETGTLPMEAIIVYKKFMLYHNITNSDDRRLMKQVVEIQQQDPQMGTWFRNLKLEAGRYGVDLNQAKQQRKEKWKAEVKKSIHQTTEIRIKEEAGSKTKLRTVCNDEYKMKEYLKVVDPKEAAEIMKIRLHMVQVAANYKNKKHIELCPMCNKEDDTTEHLFRCKTLETLRRIWNTKHDDIKSNNRNELVRATKYVEAVMQMRPTQQ